MGVGIFYALGGALTLEGVLSGIYMIFMLIFILKLYLDEKNFKTVFRFIYNKLTNCCSLEKGSIGVLDILPCMFVILINILMATFFAISQRPGVSRYLLAILMINMMCYEVYYVSRKVHLRLRVHNWRENEGIRPITLVYLVMSMVFMAGACYFFIKELKTSAGTPAES